MFQMIVNRPFFVAIRDELTHTILFMGWIGGPQ
jgi:serine protease inhibitor